MEVNNQQSHIKNDWQISKIKNLFEVYKSILHKNLINIIFKINFKNPTVLFNKK
jgi:hypothetical protein